MNSSVILHTLMTLSALKDSSLPVHKKSTPKEILSNQTSSSLGIKGKSITFLKTYKNFNFIQKFLIFYF